MAEATTLATHATRTVTPTSTTSSAASLERGEPRIERTPLQRLQDALMRRFGCDILWTSTANAEAAGGIRDAQHSKETTMVLHDETVEQRKRRLGKSHMTEEQAQELGMMYTTQMETGEATRNLTAPGLRFPLSSNLRPRIKGGSLADFQRMRQERTETRANTPWGLWTTAGGLTIEVIVS